MEEYIHVHNLPQCDYLGIYMCVHTVYMCGCKCVGISVDTCVHVYFFFCLFSDKASDKDVSVYQTWVSLYSAFHFSTDVSPVTLKAQRTINVQSRAQSLLYIWRTASALDGTTLNPAVTGQPGFITLWFESEQNRGDKNIKLPWAVNFLPLFILNICLILCLFSLCHSVFLPVSTCVMAFSFKKVIAEAVEWTFFL